MIQPRDEQIVFSNWKDVPDAIRREIDSVVGEKLGGPVSDLFPGFAASFPLAVSVLESTWNRPRANALRVQGEWLVYFTCEQASRNLEFNTASGNLKIYEQPYFASEQAMLPERWKALYRHFDSFHLLRHDEHPPKTGGMPVGYSKRLSISRAIQHGIPRRGALTFAKSLGSDPQWLKNWLLTDAGDSLWIDEQKCDRRVWHCHRKSPEDHAEIADPGATLDSYLAWRFSGGEARDFDFRNGAPR